MPTNHTRAPAAPNFFLGGGRGVADMAGRQACYDGALGARAMHSLRNYGKKEPTPRSSAQRTPYQARPHMREEGARHPPAPSSRLFHLPDF